ncbi:DUF7594 domain-containing protein [Rubellicoccus peritrichatus]|uniref:DNRLRE domain-containing protein n=1 Tax=Rubellicoccus peritrichatus TaxID=3080537 RepID=A0AAQ3LAL1_9BACT|nr:DNRLRE domain-containing protein [Puniceicoccus sp. CR14]WOO41034.1 DNRLRE domain-containing protein [Puniceicoccus sp. CR14]
MSILQFTSYCFLALSICRITYAQIVLTPLPSGTENSLSFSTTLSIDSVGNVSDESHGEFAVSGSSSEPASYNSYITLTIDGVAVTKTTAGDGFGGIGLRGEISRDGNGWFGVIDPLGQGMDSLNGLNIGIDAAALDPSLRVQVVALSISYIDADETGTIVNRNDTSQLITFDRIGANSATDIEIDRFDTIDVSSLNLFVDGGTANADLATIFHSNPDNGGGWRVSDLSLEIVTGGSRPLPVNPNAWRSTLYPADWTHDLGSKDFYEDKIIQDFSYAGYEHGDVPIPDVLSPVFDVTSVAYGADPNGINDSTSAIQSAINDAESAGGGVVYMPAGTYRLVLPASASTVLRIDRPNVVLRGAGIDQTYLYNETVDMRGKSIIQVAGPSSASPFGNLSPSTAVTLDLTGPRQVIPVEDADLFSPGDTVVFRSDVTEEWISEHQESGWRGYADRFKFGYVREVLAVDSVSNKLVLNAPIRYTQLLRENPRISTLGAALTQVGLEDFSIGNRQRDDTSGWENNDYTVAGTAAYQVHGSWLIKVEYARNCWVRRIQSYRPIENSLQVHMLSNGLRVLKSSAVTVEDVSMQRVQYGGAGGNGYNFRFQDACDVLVTGCVAGYNRHGFVYSHMGTSGTVIHNSLDLETRIAASGSAGSAGSDHHMHFSHSNLVDLSGAYNSFFQATYRPFGSVPMHNMTSAHTVYWNTENNGSRYPKPVETQQVRYGYAIGTRGDNTSVNTVGSRLQTDPIDHVEGEGMGDDLEPLSLYRDQVNKRQKEVRLHVTSKREDNFPVNTLPIRFFPEIGSQLGLAPENLAFEIKVLSAPHLPQWVSTGETQFKVTVPAPGSYQFCINAKIGIDGPTVGSQILDLDFDYPQSKGDIGTTTVSLHPIDDSYVRRDSGDNFGSSEILRIKEFTNTNGRVALLRFDVSQISVPDIDNSSVTLVLEKTGGDGDYDALVHAGDSGSWEENSVNWNNYPSFNNPVGSWSGGPDSGTVSIPLNAILDRVDQDDAITLQLEVTEQSSSSPVFEFASREANDSSLRPRLDIVVPDSQSYDEWLALNGVPESQSNPEDRQVAGGPSNLESYLGGIDPRQPQAPLPAVSILDNQVNFQMPWRTDLVQAGFFIPEWSNDLINWYPLQVESSSSSDIGNQRILYQSNALFVGDPTRAAFYRLRIESE